MRDGERGDSEYQSMERRKNSSVILHSSVNIVHSTQFKIARKDEFECFQPKEIMNVQSDRNVIILALSL